MNAKRPTNAPNALQSRGPASSITGETGETLQPIVSRHLWLWVVLLIAVTLAAIPAHAAEVDPGFDHLATGFALTGRHREAKCESCHLNGVLKGTPKVCATCHSQGSRFQTSKLPTQHVPVRGASCDSCHRSDAWSPARFSHAEVARGSCASCHNGVTAAGKSASHPTTSLSCDSCHRSNAWSPALFDHSQVSAGTCSTCHNGNGATGKPANHISTSQSCDVCHRSNGWTPATFNHNGVAAGSCATCHNGSIASGKSANHVPTSQSCDVCHRSSG